MAVAASLAELQPAFKRDWGIALDPLAGQLVGDSLKRSIPVAFGAVRAGAAAGVRQHREPAAGQRRLAPERDGHPRRDRRRTRPPDRAGAHREPGVVPDRRPRGDRPRLSDDRSGDAAARARRCRRPRRCRSTSGSWALPRAVAIGVSLIVGVLPALQMSSRALGNAAGLTARGSSSREGARRLIVAAEVAISLVLVCGAVLMFKSLLKLQRVDAGVRIDNVITMSADLSIGTYPNSGGRGPLHRGGRGSPPRRARRRARRGVDRRAACSGCDRVTR